eukprot:CAMPEP_0179187954 /NCGR_PEP_ID=MMETSP0796-20121207/93275_1 /TAXON_ID=73915 /ORGANISM="Pyrodinium bahamense, Strain pbaha01" /LENGTH=78 /DNA_ID=CAMNT_0020892039 /DNA_START=145 /DNA_END=381 /DNA_ORIENTATION=-
MVFFREGEQLPFRCKPNEAWAYALSSCFVAMLCILGLCAYEGGSRLSAEGFSCKRGAAVSLLTVLCIVGVVAQASLTE